MAFEKSSPATYLDVLSGQCRELAERFRLSGEQSEALKKFVTETAIKSWRNGRDSGYKRARLEGKGDATN
jgi:hypothetical protein